MSCNFLHRGRTAKAAEVLLPSSPTDRTKGSLLTCLTGSRRSGLLGPLDRIVLVVTLCVVVLLLYVSSLSLRLGTENGVPMEPPKGPPPATARHIDDAALNHLRSTEQPGQAVGPLSPKLSILVPPFKDLCEWISPTHRLSMADAVEMPAAAYATDSAFRAQLESALDRFEHVPADGGDAGRRWSAATGLPLASGRTGAEVKVRFVSVSNRIDPTTHFASVAAAMAGARLDMIGMGWEHYNFFKRTNLLLSYAQQEGLTDADVIVATDADAVMSGEDALPFFSAFVASTAADEAEHMTYRVRDIRMGRRQTPVLFSGEWSCWMVQAFSYDDCPVNYKKVYDLRERWVAASNESLQRNFNDANPFKYLNAGVMVARVWAVRRLRTVLQTFARTSKTKARGDDWWCDQTAFGGFYLDLLKWELESRAWDGAPQEVPEERWKEFIFPPKERPTGGLGPHGLPPALLSIDQTTRFSLTIEPDMSGKELFRLNSEIINSVSDPESTLIAALASGMPVETTVMGVVRSSHRLKISARDNVDCANVQHAPPECAYRNAVWGMPEGTDAVAPLVWHFSGQKKEARFAHYRAVFPWYTPTLVNTQALQQLVHVFAGLPPTRVFLIDPDTNNNVYLGDARVLAHKSALDLSVVEMCNASVLQNK